MTFMVLFVALVEVTAIYWMLISLAIIDKWADLNSMYALGAGLAIWLAWLWVAIGRWYMSEKSLEIMGQNPKMISFFLTVSILWVALIESAAIYWMVISYQILDFTWAEAAAIGAGLAIWFTWLGAWIGEWLLIKGAMDSMNKAPEIKNKIMSFMVLFVALVEVIAIYWLVIAWWLLANKAEENNIIGAEKTAIVETIEETE